MDSIMRTCIVTSADVNFIHNRQGIQKFWVLKNLGPGKITLTLVQTGGVAASVIDLDPGNMVEALCTNAHATIAAGESYDASVLQWMPGIEL